MGRPVIRLLPDGFLDRLSFLARELEIASNDLHEARRDPRDPSISHLGRIDGARCMKRIAAELRKIK